MTEVSSQSSPRVAAIAAGLIALLAFGGAGWMGWMLGWPWIVDINDPEFNPMIAVEALLIGIAVWHALKSLRWYLRHRSFGDTVLLLDGPGHLQLGKKLSGTLRSERSVAATGPFRLMLTCVDVHRVSDSGEASRDEAFPVWTAEREYPQTSDPQKGMRFSFEVPESVGPDPVPSGILTDNKAVRFRMTTHVPGFRRVFSKNSPPVDRFWMLTVTAPTSGTNFRSEMQIPVRGS
jgi:hypothetical protein